jgi:hypothetical protein
LGGLRWAAVVVLAVGWVAVEGGAECVNWRGFIGGTATHDSAWVWAAVSRLLRMRMRSEMSCGRGARDTGGDNKFVTLPI